MKYRVFNVKTKEDITYKYAYEWALTPDGKLYLDNYGDLAVNLDAIAIPEKDVEEFLKEK